MISVEEKEAIVDYVEFRLVQIAEIIEEHVDPDTLGLICEEGVNLVRSLDEIITERTELDSLGV